MTLTPLQAHALGTIKDRGVCDGHEIARSMLVDGRSLGPALRGLEHRGLIQRTYTGHRFNGHAYYITDQGEDAYEAEFGDEDADA